MLLFLDCKHSTISPKNGQVLRFHGFGLFKNWAFKAVSKLDVKT